MARVIKCFLEVLGAQVQAFYVTLFSIMKATQAFSVLSALSVITGGLAATNSSNNSNSPSNSALLANGNVRLGRAAEAYEKAKAFIAQLSNTEKISLITGQSITNASWTALANKDGATGINANSMFPASPPPAP
ncbi:uncharacterized protein BCR38DRAFT_481787 [Pseudomassariella vexata]|uniref:Uncharacterized protein n=1 Tax=Pseudomassariella vexata TaxID=1141098 RepID=A0A1Y2EBT1_9PEZI|nr:uncharacterized protein BCR38DRAFT_481787 [Pseudomassariella vexata]ORY68305.1 hypothetical protein BCR38DRAFT_481787 [Pseudomassariella vexata]